MVPLLILFTYFVMRRMRRSKEALREEEEGDYEMGNNPGYVVE